MRKNETGKKPALEALLATAAQSIRSGKALAALSPLTEILAQAPCNTEARYTLAGAYLKSGNPARALAEFETLLNAVPAHDGAAFGRGLALFALGERRSALNVFRHLTKPGPLAWKAWSSVADITPDEAERVCAVNAAADALAGLCARSGAVADRRAAAAALLAARRPHDAAMVLARQSGPVSGVPVPDLQLVRAFYHQGRFEAAFEEASRLLGCTRAGDLASKPRSQFRPDLAVSVLIEILQVLSSAGVNAFLVAGTLLGFQRSGGPLAHDRDIDMGVIRNADGGPDIAAILRAQDRILLPRITRPGDRYIGLQHRGVGVDIFLLDECNGHLACGFSDLAGDIQWRFTRFEVSGAHFGGRLWPVPDTPERYLAETYGPGWQVPDRVFASVISSPALYRTAPYARACYAALRARAALVAGDQEKAAALIRQSPVPFKVSAAEQSDRPGRAPA